MVGRPFTRQQTDQNLNIKKKTNHFDRLPKTYRPYCNWTESNPTLKPTRCFLFFSPPHFFKNNFSQPHKWHIWFCPDTQGRPFGKTKRAAFCQPTHTLFISINEIYLPIMITFDDQYYFGYEQN